MKDYTEMTVMERDSLMAELAEDERRPEEIAESINRIKAEVREKMLEGSIRIGRELKAAKSKVPYGEWGEWLEKNVDYSTRTAQNLMRIADEYGRKRTEAMEGLSITQAVLLLGLPAGERAEFVESHDMETISTDELKKQIQQLNAEKAKMQMTIDGLMEDVAAASEQVVQQEYAKAQAEAEAQAEALAQEVRHLERQLEEARKSGEAEAEAARLRTELEKAQQEARMAATKAAADRDKLQGVERVNRRLEEELEAERSRKPEVVKETPPEVLERLKRLEAEAGRGKEETALRTMYEGLLESAEAMRRRLLKAKETEPETAAKLGAAFGGALRKMAEMMEAAGK